MSFTESEKEALYKAIRLRRDVRSNFTQEALSDEMLTKILQAAHHAPSVGYMQPWNFIVIRGQEKKKLVKQAFVEAKALEAQCFEGERRKMYENLKLEGIVEAPVNICVTCDRQRDGETGIGRSQQSEMDLYSTVCAIQNLWLAARSEGIGVGWVSIVDRDELRKIFKIPEPVEIVAYLCVGYTDGFGEMPELEEMGWRQRLPLEDLIFQESWPEEL